MVRILRSEVNGTSNREPSATTETSLIPEIWRNNHPEWDVVCGDCIPMKGNYRLVADNLLDPSHVSFLHRFDVDSDPLHRNTEGAKYARNTNTVFDVAESPGGLLIGARRSADEGRYYWRINQYKW